jgi:hypothetical protein
MNNTTRVPGMPGQADLFRRNLCQPISRSYALGWQHGLSYPPASREPPNAGDGAQSCDRRLDGREITDTMPLAHDMP